jgi:hypothetical protein
VWESNTTASHSSPAQLDELSHLFDWGTQQLTNSLFAWLISHQPAVLFSHNKPASSTLLSEQTSTSHQPPANRTGCKAGEKVKGNSVENNGKIQHARFPFRHRDQFGSRGRVGNK